ncbi:MAG TPA: AMP-binding protein [Burkholderiales bacterium]|nr:AMP-binding protein [Burkholderiales bacterium]
MKNVSLIHLVRQAGRRCPERVALRFDDRAWSYGELERVTDGVAAGLRARGVRHGDRVAFLLPNSPELVFLNLACLTIGAIAVPMNVRLKGPELAYILDHCRACLCVVDADLYGRLEAVRPDLAHTKAFFVVGPNTPDCEPFEALIDRGQAEVALAANPDDVAAILYTSGTTARPKGVTHTHRSLVSTVENYAEAVRLCPDDVVLGMLSMSHIFGYTLQLLSPLAVGATVLATPTFDAAHVLTLIDRYRVTHLYGLPVMFDTLSSHAVGASRNLASLKYCLAGGDAVSQALTARVQDTLGVELYEGCGMTEVIPYALNRPGIENRTGSIGQPSVGMRLRVVDADGNDVAHGETGEILVKSDALTIGYWEDPEATAGALREGWLHTGDLGYRDAAGYYWFVGRRKEIIVRGGSNVSPIEVESALARHPAVREVGVVGAPHPSLGEIVAAFVVLKSGTVVTAQELLRFAAGRIADYKIPERVTFLADLPRGLTGKVHRKTLREWAAS